MDIEDDLQIEKEAWRNRLFCVIVIFVALVGVCTMSYSMITENLPASKQEYEEALRLVAAANQKGHNIGKDVYGEMMRQGKLTKKEYGQIKKVYEEIMEKAE